MNPSSDLSASKCPLIISFTLTTFTFHSNSILHPFSHPISFFFFVQLYTFFLFLDFSYFQNSPGLFAAFGFNSSAPTMPVLVGLVLFSQTIWSPVDKVLYASFFLFPFSCFLFLFCSVMRKSIQFQHPTHYLIHFVCFVLLTSTPFT
jgi:hypothetical protein